jgi:hypothetical protein
MLPAERSFNQPVQNTGLFGKQLLLKIPVPLVLGDRGGKRNQLDPPPDTVVSPRRNFVSEFFRA